MKFNYIVGAYFLIIQVLIIIMNLQFTHQGVFFWFCNHVPFIFAIAFFFKEVQIVKALISVGFIAQILWIIDFLGKLLFDIFVFGFTAYVFDLSGLLLVTVILVHFFSTTVAIVFSATEDILPKSLWYSAAYIVVLYVSTIVFTASQYNVNCGYALCGFEELSIPYYTIIVPFVAFVVLVIPGYYLQKGLTQLYKHFLTK